MVSVAAIITSSVNSQDGRREILGLGLGDSEPKSSGWTSCAACGASGNVQLIISDAHEGLAAIGQVFTARWQRCRVHFHITCWSACPKTSQSLVGTLVRQIFVQPDAASAGCPAAGRRSTPRPRFPKAAALMDQPSLRCWPFAVPRRRTG